MSEKYQSRVFTFASSRANRLKDSCAKGLRHLKVAVVWGGQILLSPLQWLARVTKIFQPQLPPPRQQSVLSQPASDINIEQALELVKVAGYPIEITQNGTSTFVDLSEIEITQPAPVRVDRSTVDATFWQPDNGNIAIAAPPEIIYTRAHPLLAPKKTIRGLSSLLSDRKLVLVTNENEILDILTLAQQQEIRRRIGLDLAIDWHHWQTIKLSSDRDTKKLSGTNQLFLGEDSNLDREIPAPNLFDRLSDWFKKERPAQADPLFPIADLDTDRQKDLQQLAPSSYSFTPQPPQIDRYLDLPQLPPIQEADLAIEPENSIGKIIAKFQPRWVDRLWNYYRDYVYIPAPTDDTIVYQPPQEFELIPLEPKPSKIVVNRLDLTEDLDEFYEPRQLQSSAKLTKKVLQNVEYHPDWIEAISEEIGYSRSPFSRLLAWLDRIVLAIENWIIEMWNKIFIS